MLEHYDDIVDALMQLFPNIGLKRENFKSDFPRILYSPFSHPPPQDNPLKQQPPANTSPEDNHPFVFLVSGDQPLPVLTYLADVLGNGCSTERRLDDSDLNSDLFGCSE